MADLSPSDNFLPSQLKKYLEGNRYDSNDQVNGAESNHQDYQLTVCANWSDFGGSCVDFDGDYVEK